MIFTLRHAVFDFATRCHYMGIVNVTPDSFSDGGAHNSAEAAIAHAMRLAEEGADIVDIGGESTRPGAEPVNVREELRRVIPVIEGLRSVSDIPVSIDTRNATVAEEAVKAGVDMINDVSALRHDHRMAAVAAAFDVPVVLMHMQGVPATMQADPSYEDVVADVAAFFRDRIGIARSAGIRQIVIDPGIGFGKRLADNLALLRNLSSFAAFDLPVLVGTSRKAFIGALTGAGVEDRLPGTIASCVLAAKNGAAILRVHDVRAVRMALQVSEAITGAEAAA